jgi:hypothetical protein
MGSTTSSPVPGRSAEFVSTLRLRLRLSARLLRRLVSTLRPCGPRFQVFCRSGLARSRTKNRCRWQQRFTPIAAHRDDSWGVSRSIHGRNQLDTHSFNRLASLVRGPYAGFSTIFQYESLRITFPSRNSQWSHPRTRTRTPSAIVPVSVHSDTPILPLTQCRP